MAIDFNRLPKLTPSATEHLRPIDTLKIIEVTNGKISAVLNERPRVEIENDHGGIFTAAILSVTTPGRTIKYEG